jgi:hypothetical protein
MVLPVTALVRLAIGRTAVTTKATAVLCIWWWRVDGLVAHDVDGDRVGQPLDGGR